MRVAKMRWVLVPLIVLIAGCLPQPPADLPASFLAQFDGAGKPRFSEQTPPLGSTGQDIVALFRTSSTHPMYWGRAVPLYGIIDCSGMMACSLPFGGGVGGHLRVWVILYPDCTDGSDIGWALVGAVGGLSGGVVSSEPCDR